MRSIGLRTQLARPFLRRRLPPGDHDALLLTFDDGPSPAVTDAVLERLDRHGVRAAFFLVGRRVEAAPEAARRIAEAGHAIGNHSHAHAMAAWPPLGPYLTDLDRCNAAVRAAVGRDPVAFRAPGGRLHWAAVVAARRRRLPHVHWSIDPRDWTVGDDDGARRLGDRVAARVRDRDIVLLHDDRPSILPLLDVLLPALRTRGFDLAGGLARLGLDGSAP